MSSFLLNKRVFLLLPAQKASPGQSVNVALGQFGVNIPKCLKLFNEKSMVYPESFLIGVNVLIFPDNSFELFIKGPSVLFFFKSFIKKGFINKKDLLFCLFLLRLFRKDLDCFSDYSLVKCLIGTLKSYYSVKFIF